MSNMSYCRFQNTANDLQDCLDNFDDPNLEQSEEEPLEGNDLAEYRARRRIIEMARIIVDCYAD